MKHGTRGYGMLALFLIVGAVLGGILGEVIADSPSLAGIFPYLVKHFSIFDLPPVTINLYVVKLVVGLALQPNLLSIIGVILAIIVFRRF